MIDQQGKLTPNPFFLVTGTAGFIGSHIVKTLLGMGYRVRGVDNFSTGRHEVIKSLMTNPLYSMVEGDIRDIQICRQACEGVDYVLHQAAVTSVTRSIDEPILYEDVNVGGTLRMLEAARQAGVKKFIYASSSAVYGDRDDRPSVEGKEGKPLSPYALTKLLNEMYAEYYWRAYGLPTIGLRYFNVFGPQQDPDSPYAAVIPRFITALLEDSRIVIYGDGEQSRDFVHVMNVVNANLLACAASSEANGKVYNIASGQSMSVNQLLDALQLLTGRKAKVNYLPFRSGDIRHSLADISNSQCYLGYRPSVDFWTGLQQTVQSYQGASTVTKSNPSIQASEERPC